MLSCVQSTPMMTITCQSFRKASRQCDVCMDASLKKLNNGWYLNLNEWNDWLIMRECSHACHTQYKPTRDFTRLYYGSYSSAPHGLTTVSLVTYWPLQSPRIWIINECAVRKRKAVPALSFVQTTQMLCSTAHGVAGFNLSRRLSSKAVYKGRTRWTRWQQHGFYLCASWRPRRRDQPSHHSPELIGKGIFQCLIGDSTAWVKPLENAACCMHATRCMRMLPRG